MIRCTRTHFERVCARRGYTLEDVRPCIVADDGERLTVDETSPAFPRAKIGLGDMVKSGLSAIGITEDRVSKVLGRPCGCSERAEKLNQLGRRIGIG